MEEGKRERMGRRGKRDRPVGGIKRGERKEDRGRWMKSDQMGLREEG